MNQMPKLKISILILHPDVVSSSPCDLIQLRSLTCVLAQLNCQLANEVDLINWKIIKPGHLSSEVQGLKEKTYKPKDLMELG